MVISRGRVQIQRRRAAARLVVVRHHSVVRSTAAGVPGALALQIFKRGCVIIQRPLAVVWLVLAPPPHNPAAARRSMEDGAPGALVFLIKKRGLVPTQRRLAAVRIVPALRPEVAVRFIPTVLSREAPLIGMAHTILTAIRPIQEFYTTV